MLHGVRAPVLRLLVVEERVRPRGEDLVREHRRFGRVDGVHAHRRRTRCARAARADRRRRALRASVSSTVWRTITWSGISIGPTRLSWHAAACGNIAAMRSSASMRWIGGGLRRPPRNRSTSSARLRFQRHREMNIGASSTACCKRLLDGAAADVARDLVEREAVVRTERQHDRVVARRGLQLEVERAAELLAQRETERAVDPAAVRRVDHELHAAGVVEEPLEHERVERRHRAEHGAAARDVVDDHRGGVAVERRRSRAATRARRRRRRARGTRRRAPRSARHLGRELGRARRRLAAPERHRRRRVARVDDAHDAGFDAPDLPRVRAEQEDVAGHRLDGPVLVDGADEEVVGLGEHAVVADLGDRAARRRPRRAARPCGRAPCR